MAQQYFEVERGFKTAGAVIIAGSGAPDGVTGDNGSADKGSIYLDTLNGSFYFKKDKSNSADDWIKAASASDLTNASWREPVVTIDELTTVLPTGTPGADWTSADTVPVTVTDKDRVLFTGLTDGNNLNIYTYDKTAGTFTETPNEATVGDFVYVGGGNELGVSYVYVDLDGGGNKWVKTNKSETDELASIRNFIGKGVTGSDTPTFDTTNYLAAKNDLEAGIIELDAQIKENEDGLATELQDRADQDDIIEASVGLDVDGNYVVEATSNYISTATSIHDATVLLDTQAKANADEIIRVEEKVDANREIIDRSHLEVAATNVSTETVIDTVVVDDATVVNWTVYVQDSVSPQNRRAVKITAMHNGTTASDANEVEYNKYSIVQSGTEISGLTITVDQSGTGAAQVMNLKVAAAGDVDVASVRETIRFPSTILA